ncbi:3-isopropylmalate dehydratase small subunit OS=Tsukamurella paurometabola (strain ATCC 8368 / DSM / CCUG 35730 / CIP 100753 / JCM 10117 / KCTC 9821 / NBRC 16120 / NCIMB 702349 / NCTC 13040) OX=521096 GN=Tpau_1545 PE=3 SV=1 [Tsukamurella paurometabola]|uniref:3-isopropylmalate dehydratase small subunit n=1 Tax=Tsukamurella paurometabola (strain ATCC 8368 / DSM 20162 / CCUG 35730 / CIP 100753 / JCM 10117 / KCTC 9821 / NBRC 16120 / NCIMB 702349 / NCTC 13040) TaxID=521096 RepID=D5UY60_TSUPD|nr:aconitate hydratase [Tsukamurella paurometabola]ADG78167.1 aconitate hydratase domain protein [Tsukamurella paurometabola DSM 20162]SUP30503.1 3-isopropylmalate dehydratase small subunit 1 [Tsukamurella paurometabola]
MTTRASAVRDLIVGTAVAIDGDDIDTDRIIPARYLKLPTFDTLGEHVFEGDRLNAAALGRVHPFDDESRVGARILLSGANFGCGSSREHAPQALNRWGIAAIIAVSYGEIFRDNAATIGLPCVTAAPEDIAVLREAVNRDAGTVVRLSLETMTATAEDRTVEVELNSSQRHRFRTGSWDTLITLQEAAGAASEVAAVLPYLNDFRVAVG